MQAAKDKVEDVAASARAGTEKTKASIEGTVMDSRRTRSGVINLLCALTRPEFDVSMHGACKQAAEKMTAGHPGEKAAAEARMEAEKLAEQECHRAEREHREGGGVTGRPAGS